MTIPYIAGGSERLKNSYKSFGISTAFKLINTLRGKLAHVEDKPPKDKPCNLVYGLTCVAPDCGESYVGETKQSLKARLNQHRRPSTNEAQNSAVYNHCKASNHSFKPEEVVILDKEDRWFKGGVREAIWERVEQPAVNKKGDFASSCHMHGMRRSDVFPAVYHVTNQKPDEVWSFQTQRSQSELQKLISSIWLNLFVILL